MTRKYKKIVLILGGARSGKSAYAQQAATKTGGKVLFCATAEPLDGDMKRRISRHRSSRPSSWHTLEAPYNLAEALAPMAGRYDTIIIDCITVLVANIMGKHRGAKRQEDAILAEIQSLTGLLQKLGADCYLISNEVGSGVIPAYRSGRQYRDHLGRVNQLIAACADEVYLLAAGIPLRIK
jgi:adenosylcobinamide kinase/adenosylcobinamide-phosphate guanylyltransferase